MAEPRVSNATSPATQGAGSVVLVASPWGVPRADGGLWAKDPSAVRFGDRYLMYFSLAPTRRGTNQGLRIGIAESTDLLSWKVIGTLDPAGDYDARGVAPGAVVIGGVVHLFYQTYGNGRLDAICHAWSTDGVNFTRDSSNPVFRPSGRWNCGRAIDADVMVDDDRLLLAYTTRDPKMRVQMVGIAATPLAGNFSRASWRDLSVDEPALRPELPWERDCIEAPAFVRRGENCSCSTQAHTTMSRSRLATPSATTASRGPGRPQSRSCRAGSRARGIRRRVGIPVC